jgi:hypothetical protein
MREAFCVSRFAFGVSRLALGVWRLAFGESRAESLGEIKLAATQR